MEMNQFSSFSHLNSDLSEESFACICRNIDRWEQDISHEMLLPDYIPDNARPVNSMAVLHLSEVSLGGGELLLRGEITHTLLTMDGEGKLRAVTTPIPLEMRRDMPDGEGCLVSMPAVVSEAGCRPLSPRKAALRCKVTAFPVIWEKRSVLPEISGAQLSDMELDETEAVGAVLSDFSGTGIAVSEDITVESALPAVGEILTSTVELSFPDLHPSQGGLDFSGEGILRVLYLGEDGSLNQFSSRIPLSGNLSSESAAGDSAMTEGEFLCWGAPYGLSVNAENNSYGERRVLEVDFHYDVKALSAVNRPLSVVRDLYCVGADTDSERGTLPLRRLKRGMSTNFTVNALRSRIDCNAADVRTVLSSSVSLSVPVWSTDGDSRRTVMEAAAEVNLLTAAEDGTLLPVHFTCPVRYELDGVTDLPVLALLTPANIRGRLDSGNVYCDFEVMISLMQWESSSVEAVVSAAVSRSGEKKARLPIVLCYPKKGERLWEIAKYYNTTTEAVASLNHLTGDVVGGEKVLIIPRKKNKTSFVV